MLRFLSAIVFSVALMFSPAVSAGDGPQLLPGDSIFRFSNWDGPAFNVHVFVPDSVLPETTIVIVIHGFSRNIDGYFKAWRTEGARHGFIVVVPYFDAESFPGSNEFNLGHIFDADSGARRPESSWTYSAIELLFDELVKRLAGKQTGYTLFGHSAGAQFVHRFLYYKPQARATRYIAANAGWYMLPDMNVEFPYGFKNSGLDLQAISTAFQKDLIVLLGTADTDTGALNLRQTKEALSQGQHRLQRGRNFYQMATEKAQIQGKNLRWQLLPVDGAAHSNTAMAGAAAMLIGKP